MNNLPPLMSLAVVLSIVLCGQPALACSCLQAPPPNEALQGADAVFSGIAVEFRMVSEWYENSGPRPKGAWARYEEEGVSQNSAILYTRFDVIGVWKGVDEHTVWVRSNPYEDMCGKSFGIGERYIVYSHWSETDSVLTTGLCTRTSSISRGHASADLEALPEPSHEVWRTRARDIAEAIRLHGAPFTDGVVP